jgi:hypothetical protein
MCTNIANPVVQIFTDAVYKYVGDLGIEDFIDFSQHTCATVVDQYALWQASAVCMNYSIGIFNITAEVKLTDIDKNNLLCALVN